MRIENLRFEKTGDRARVTATVLWEDCGRPTQDIYFETVEEFADSLSCNPHAFLVACIMPALYFGEERISIEEGVCPELRDGLEIVLNWMRYWWYEPTKKIVRIEAKTSSGNVRPETNYRAGFFFSGGVDSLSALRANRLNYPSDHPGSFKDGLLVCGLEIRDLKIFGYVQDSLSLLAKDADVKLIPIYTNIRELGPEDSVVFWEDFWKKEFMGATFASVAHVLAKRLTSLSNSSDHDIPNMHPFSSHPLINPYYSSSDLRVRLEGFTLSRLDKTSLLAGWDSALQHLRVCNKTELYQPGMLNCGKCEKCVRTMISLLVFDVLKKASAFPLHEVSEEMVNICGPLASNTFFFSEELVAPLVKIGRHDLSRAIERKIAEYHHSERSMTLRKKYVEPILEYDQKHFNGRLRALKRVFFRGGAILGK